MRCFLEEMLAGRPEGSVFIMSVQGFFLSFKNLSPLRHSERSRKAERGNLIQLVKRSSRRGVAALCYFPPLYPHRCLMQRLRAAVSELGTPEGRSSVQDDAKAERAGRLKGCKAGNEKRSPASVPRLRLQGCRRQAGEKRSQSLPIHRSIWIFIQLNRIMRLSTHFFNGGVFFCAFYTPFELSVQGKYSNLPVHSNREINIF